MAILKKINVVLAFILIFTFTVLPVPHSSAERIEIEKLGMDTGGLLDPAHPDYNDNTEDTGEGTDFGPEKPYEYDPDNPYQGFYDGPAYPSEQ